MAAMRLQFLTRRLNALTRLRKWSHHCYYITA